MNISGSNQCAVHTIVGEVQSVIATMRNNNKFSTLSTRESPLLKEFKQLRSQLRPSTDIEKLDPMIYLKPFLNVIHSEETSGPITGAALTSVDKFLTYGFLKDSAHASKVMKKIADTVVHCRFEATSLEGDDVVLMKILRVLLSCLSCPAGGLLSDDSVFEMIMICYRMSRGRLSELLKKTAERTLTELVHIIFLVNNIHNKCYNTDTIQNVYQQEDSLIPPPSPPVLDNKASNGRKTSTDYVNPRGVRFQRVEVTAAPGESPSAEYESSQENQRNLSGPIHGEPVLKPYGVRCVIKTFKFLVELTSPNDENVPESLRQISIQLLNTIIETQPQLIERIPPLLELLCNQLCKSMLQNLHTENLDRLNLTMRFFFNLHISLRSHLKMQFEIFFNNLLKFILQNSKYVSFEKQEIVLENLVQFFYQPNFMTDIFANYDCHIHCTNTLEKLTGFLYKSAFPINGTLYSIQLLSMECLLALLETISSRCTTSNQSLSIDSKTSELLLERASKSKFSKAAEAFNKKPVHGLQYLEEQEMIPRNPSMEDIAKFLKNAPGLDKKKVGEYLGKQDKEFIRAYVKTFDFTGIGYVDAVRLFLTSFVMSGEAQIIDRIVESFAHHWYFQNPRNNFATADVAYVLCYSIVMLNVDAHNVGVRVKMTEDQYIHRLRGINDGKDLPRDFLQEIYRNITQNEIKITDDTPENEISDEKWNALLQRGIRIGSFITGNVHSLDKDVFLLVCRTIVAALSIVFETTNESEILDDVVSGFANCSSIACHFKLHAVFDNVIVHLCKFTTLTSKNKPQQYSPKRITLFGTDNKAQLATTSMFKLVLRYGDHIREAWRNVVRCIIALHSMDLLDGLIDEDPFEGTKKTKKTAPKEGSSSTGLLSFIPSWWASEPVEEELNQSDVEAEKSAKQTVSNCSIKSLVESSCQLQSESLVYFIKALILDSAYPYTANRDPNFSEASAMFCLELLTKITLINHSRIKFVWMLVSDHFASIVQMAKTPSEYVEKAIVCLLLLCVTLAPKKEVSSNIFGTFELFLKLEPQVASAMSESIIIAVSRFIQTNYESITNTTSWNIILALVERSATSPLAYERGFQSLQYLLKVNTPHIPILTEEAFNPYLKAVLAYVNITERKNNKLQYDQPPQPILTDTNQPIPLKAMNILYSLFENASQLLGKSTSNPSHTQRTLQHSQESVSHPPIDQTQLWEFYWLPIFRSWIHLCRDPRNDIRTHAMTLLQRALLSQYLDVLTPIGIQNCFEEVMFPLLESLLQPFSNVRSETSRVAIEETQVRAQQLLAKSLLQYLNQLTQLPDFHINLWPRILCVIESYMKVDQIGLLKEAIPEVLKNILLVMLQMNVFHPSNSIDGVDIWNISWMTIDGFCPSLKEDESFRASLNTFQRVPMSSQRSTVEASNVIHQLARKASSPKTSLHASESCSSLEQQTAKPKQETLSSQSYPSLDTHTTTDI